MSVSETYAMARIPLLLLGERQANWKTESEKGRKRFMIETMEG
jgi:hypothetical protein